ncbi:FAD-binding oxidoreductase [Nocardia macrotermitis]|uniref:Putative FAD-linked oxidoreductase YvdP n=1 Tax=Nocardia macrotermitis TaxID=2585198 RepID=A0A7K0CVA0_9NOCA|nr:FAD-binding oxidoreductase [Nocardia macrotermitis]MQY17303.1 putative FAD-linked oxidoreductase YvdP [Nocardia macrotermitis]
MTSNDRGPVRRRALLRGVGTLTVAAAVTRPGIAGAETPDWTDLRKRLQGKLLLPTDGEYTSAKQLFDPQFDGDAPVAVVEAAAASDLVAAVAFARDHRLPLATRAGGHSYVGASATTGALVLDVRGLHDITVTDDLVTVGAGVPIRAVLAELDKSGRSLPVGSCPTVGLAGLTLGGGLGVDSRRYGLTCDALESAEVVLPGGGTAHTSATRLPGLFWALRGGGGSAGILTSLTFRTHPAVSRDIVRLSFPADAAARVLTGWARWMPTADRAVWSNVEIGAVAGTVECSVMIVTPAGQGTAATANLTAAAAATPISVTHRTLGHLAVADDIAGGSTTPRSTKVAGSDVVRELNAAVAGAIVDIVTARSRSGAPGYVLLDPLDGAIRDTRTDATAFPWRAHAASLQWIVDAPDSPADARAWITGAHRALGAASVGAYANYVEPGVPADRYYGGNIARLRAAARNLDPNRLLRTGITL